MTNGFRSIQQLPKTPSGVTAKFRIFRVVTVFCFLLINFSVCFAQKSAETTAMFDTTNFQLSYSKKDIPRAFKKHFITAYHHTFNIANPEEDFCKSCSCNRNLTPLRLIFTSKKKENGMRFLYCDVGGMTWRSYLFITVYAGKKITKELVLQIPNEVRNYFTLKQSVKEHNYKVIDEN